MCKRLLIPVFLLLLTFSAIVQKMPEEVLAQADFEYFFPIFAQQDGFKGFSSIGPDGGTVTSIAIDPTDSNILYAGTWGNGIYKSVNGGGQWRHQSVGFRAGFVFELAIDPEDHQHLLASAYRYGAYESFNGGETWAKTGGLPDETVVYSFAFHPGNSDVVYAAVRLKTTYNPDPHYPGGVYKSIDGGTHWTRQSQGLPDDYVYDVVIDPKNPKVLYTAMHKTGVYKSVDGGASWTSVNNNIHYRDARSLAIDPENSIIYVGMYDGKGVAYSTDGGSSWSTIASSVTQALYVYRLLLDPHNPGSLYLNTPDGLFRCNGDPYPDNQSNCGRLAHDNRYVFALALDPESTSTTGETQTLYTGLQTHGLYKSTDGGQSFTASYQGLKSNVVLSILNDPESPSTLYASILGRGVFKSSDSGQNWLAIRDGLPSPNVNVLAFRPGKSNVLYAGTEQDGIYFSTNGGQSWAATNAGIAPSRQVIDVEADQAEIIGFNHPSYAWMDPIDIEAMQVPIDEENAREIRAGYPEILTIQFNPSDTSKMFAGTAGVGVLKSSDYGESWGKTELTWGDVYDSIVDISQPVFKFPIGVLDAGIRGSDLAMTSWPARNVGFHPYADVYGLAMSGGGKYFAASDKGIYRSINAGGTWSLAGLSNLRFNDIFVHPDRPGEIWAASSDGLYFSSDGGSYWELVGNANLNDQFLTIAGGYGGIPVYFGMSGGNIYCIEQ